MLSVKIVPIAAAGHFHQLASQPVSGNSKNPEVIEENNPQCNEDRSAASSPYFRRQQPTASPVPTGISPSASLLAGPGVWVALWQKAPASPTSHTYHLIGVGEKDQVRVCPCSYPRHILLCLTTASPLTYSNIRTNNQTPEFLHRHFHQVP